MTDVDEIAEQLVMALRAVDQADVPSDLRGVAFDHALKFAATGESVHRKGQAAGQSEEGYSLLSEIASRVGADYEVVSSVFEEKDDAVHLIVGRTQLPNGSSRAASMRDVALLVASGRQAAGLEDYTATSVIRRECEEIGVLDSSNFSVEVARLGMRARGGSKSREVHATRHQLELAGELMTRIVGGEGS